MLYDVNHAAYPQTGVYAVSDGVDSDSSQSQRNSRQ